MGRTTRIAAPARVCLPPECFRPRYRTRAFPAAGVLTGCPGTAEALVGEPDHPGTALDPAGSGRARPVIPAMPRPAVAPPRDTERVDVPGGPRTESFLARGLPGAVLSPATGWAASPEAGVSSAIPRVVTARRNRPRAIPAPTPPEPARPRTARHRSIRPPAISSGGRGTRESGGPAGVPGTRARAGRLTARHRQRERRVRPRGHAGVHGGGEGDGRTRIPSIILGHPRKGRPELQYLAAGDSPGVAVDGRTVERPLKMILIEFGRPVGVLIPDAA